MHKKLASFSGNFSDVVLDEIPDMVRVIASDAKVLYVNKAFRERFGNRVDSVCTNMPGTMRECPECIALKCIWDQRRYSTISYVRGFVYSVSAGPVMFDDVACALEVFTDITKEHNLKDKLIANNSRMMKDLEIARSLQLSILRHNLPAIDGYGFSAEFLPCEALGGDMYDCFLTRDGRILMYIADVSGHGVMPAMLTVYLRQEMFAQCKTPGITPAQVLSNIQVSFEELNTEESIYITIFVIAIDPKTGAYVYANAGHSVPPLIAGQGRVKELFMPGTPICRWVFAAHREEEHGVLKKGERLFLYTDGLDGIHSGPETGQKLNGILLSNDLEGAGLLEEIKKNFARTKADDVTMLLCERYK